MGRPYEVVGTVVEGDGRGARIGFPTANLHAESELLPAPGVYVVRAAVDDDAPLDGVANLGVRPTFSGDRFAIEVHLLDVQAGLYGRRMRLRFVERLRAERRFDGVEALVAQIARDVERAREVLGAG
jgi:riboflavin kinase/FMN adenylyltransferase